MKRRTISNLRQWLVKQTYYSALVIGLTSLKFKFESRQFAQSKFLQIYVICVNTVFIALSPVLCFKALEGSNFCAGNSQMKQVNKVNVYIRCIVVILTVLFRWRRDRRMKKLIEGLLQLEHDYLERVTYPSAILKRYERLFIFKFFGEISQSMCGIYMVYRFWRHSSVWWYVSFVYVVLVIHILLGVIIHFCMGLLFIGSRFEILNYRLREMYTTLRLVKTWSSLRSQQHMERALAAELHYITYAHSTLRTLTHQLNDSFKVQVMTVLLTQVLNIVAMGYYGAMMVWDPMPFKLDSFDVAMGLVNYCVMILDMHLLDVNCQTLQQAYEETGTLLKRFYEFDKMEEALEKSCDQLSLYLMQEKLFINITGLFNLNVQTSFVMMGFMLRHVLILVQNDLANKVRDIQAQRHLGKALQKSLKHLMVWIDDIRNRQTLKQ